MPNEAETLDRIVKGIQQLNVNVERLNVSLKALIDTAADHEERLRRMERWRHSLTPVLAAVTFVLGIIVTATLQRFI